MIDILNKLKKIQKSISQNKNEEKSDNDQFDRVRRLFDDYTSLIDQLKFNLASKRQHFSHFPVLYNFPVSYFSKIQNWKHENKEMKNE